MAPTATKQETHRPGPLKQTHKPHKGGRNGKRHSKGKIEVKAISHRKKHELNRLERRNQLNQLRNIKKEETLRLKRGFQAAPILVTILPVDDEINAVEFLENIKSCDDLVVTQSALGHCHISSPRLKQRYAFLIPNKLDHHSVMDAFKVSEVLLLLHSSNPPDEYMNVLFSVMIAHVLPTTVHVIQGVQKLNPKKKAEYKKLVLKSVESRFPDAKLQQADTQQELQLLLRQIGSQKKHAVGFRDNRFHMMVESAAFEHSDLSSGKGTLKVSGYVRGQPLNVNGLVHLAGWGSFQMTKIEQKYDPHASEKGKKTIMFETSEEANPLDQESLQSEVVPDPMEGEQTWPTQEELEAAERQTEKITKRVAEGTSEYQAAWIVESENEESGDSDDDSEDAESQMMSEDESVQMEDSTMDDTESVSNNKDENYDKKMDMDEERQTLVRFKEEMMNQMFPDEEDTPNDISARVRYQKYRGLKNFKWSPWDPLENLPLDYAKIYRFQNFNHTKKKVLKTEREGFEPGSYVTIHIKDVPAALYDSVNAEKSTFVVYGLLPHEQKMSVMNCVIQKHKTCEIPIKSKDTLIFHIGFNRFTCKPIFSEHKTGSKFKYERYLPPDSAVVASFFAPVLFPPASVVVFRQKQNGMQELVATGSVLNVDPNRVVVKRVVLSGHPFRIMPRGAVVRFMFFNKEDINWFKCVELSTKYGRKGHIKDALGTHGHMKCVFDQQLQSMDVVLMNLYKRAFPKWTYNPYVPSPINYSEDLKIP